ncbi:MAG: isoleucine--tRNA ligase [Thermotogae bacterium]|jgi:isoleucyl-tRNA synthetase|nr:isoleucine--tRNA ligase [Thermotogota bacterium]MCL5031971.1 isoleucine--tRNA ligase [Thermotogota bacterium]
MDYKNTLNLPVEVIPMKANLVEKEPKILKQWDLSKIYDKIRKNRDGAPKYVLHDGPPYANGSIHIGTALNKVLKDIVVRYKTMRGYDSPYIPGWDTHGLPIEHKVALDLGDKIKSMQRMDIRKMCADYAKKYVDVQREQFKRLGIFGEWDKPYLTMDKSYESAIYEIFADAVEKGMVYRENKPVMWCIVDHTALAEAEVEYKDETSKSIYVKFRFKDDPHKFVIIWTTTPWTLPANRAVALNPAVDYSWIKIDGERWLMAKALVSSVMTKAGIQNYEITGEAKGSTFELKKLLEPLYGNAVPAVMADYVETETGTGAVHTAPGHGEEDYMTGKKYGLEIFSPVDDYGNYVPDLPKYGGLSIKKAEEIIIKDLKNAGMLVAEENFTHPYPHCWRCHKPLIFRATEQWFISVDKNDLRKKTLKAIEEDVKWIPSWGENRIHSMIETRPDWCISRQRDWGMPIPAFRCKKCGNIIMDDDVIRHVAKIVEREGSDAWYKYEAKELLPQGYRCPKCGGDEFEKLYDVMDVWIDSGSSFEAVLKSRGLYPAALYLEGTDQHRGWFHSSLLLGMIRDGRPPYDNVLTHGFIRDENDQKMSKSLGNVIDPLDIIKKFGADVLRLWVSSTEYKNDVRISTGIIEKQVDAYRKVRNVLRFIFGNLADFDPQKDKVGDLIEIDRYALELLNALVKNVTQYYDDFDFHKVYHAVFDFITIDMSAFYLDVLKDRLYADGKNSHDRRSAQTVLYEIGMSLLKILAPMIPFTTEEIYTTIQFKKFESIHLENWSEVRESDNFMLEKWSKIRNVRDVVLKALEAERQNGHIGHPLEAEIDIKADGELFKVLKSVQFDLANVMIVSSVSIVEGEDLDVKVKHAHGQKCERCWKYSETVGQDKAYPTLCSRCVEVIREEDF